MNDDLLDISEADLAFAVCSGQQKCRLRINIPCNRVYIRVLQGRGSYRTPDPDLTNELIVDPRAQRVECMVHGTCYRF